MSGDLEPLMLRGQVERDPEALVQGTLPTAALIRRPRGLLTTAQYLRLETHNSGSNPDRLSVISTSTSISLNLGPFICKQVIKMAFFVAIK